LVVVGTGMRAGNHLTREAHYWLERSEIVLYLVADVIMEALIQEINPKAQSLAGHYGEHKPRRQTYDEMVERILAHVREGALVCVAAYGHAGVFAYPTHEAVRRARREGFEATMLPAISTEDCLFADLGVDPGIQGCQSFEATDFLLRK